MSIECTQAHLKSELLKNRLQFWAQPKSAVQNNTFMTAYNKTAGKSAIITLESIIKIDSNGKVCLSVEIDRNEVYSTQIYSNVIKCPLFYFRPRP